MMFPDTISGSIMNYADLMSMNQNPDALHERHYGDVLFQQRTETKDNSGQVAHGTTSAT